MQQDLKPLILSVLRRSSNQINQIEAEFESISLQIN